MNNFMDDNHKDIDTFLRTWSKRKIIDGQSFDDLLNIEGIPLWWFYNRIFVRHIMPAPINTFTKMNKRQKLRSLEKLKLNASAKIIKRYITINEKRKIKFFQGVKKQQGDKNKQSENEQSETEKLGRKVLFLTYSNHIESSGKLFRVQNIIDKIKCNRKINDGERSEGEEEKIKEFILFTDPLSSRSYKKIKDFNNIYQYYDEEIAQKADEISFELYRKWQGIKKSKKEELLTIDGFSLNYYLKYGFDVFFSREFFFLLTAYYEIFKKIIAAEKIAAGVITAQNSLFEKCLIAAAEKHKIPVLRIQHGIGEDLVKPDSTAEIYNLVFSNYVKEKKVESGCREDKVRVVGPVIFDEISRYIKPKESKGKNILIGTTPSIQSNVISNKDYFARIRKVVKAIKSIPNAKLSIKLHPREVPVDKCIANYREITDKHESSNIKIFKGKISRDKFYQLMQWCDLYINFGSTSAIEAMIIGRPVLTVNIFDDKYVTGWMEDKKISVNVDHSEDIKAAIEKALEDRDETIIWNRMRFIEEKCGVVDGKAHERVVEVIEELC